MHTGRGFERLVNFSDATVAIALTLLVLPLLEIPADADQQSLGELIGDNKTELTSFLISFLVVWALWGGHHATMEYFCGYDEVLVRLHMLWLLTIVVLPFLTELLNGDEHVDGADPLYVGTLLLSSLTLRAIAGRGRRHPELLHPDHPGVQTWLAQPQRWVTVAIMAVSLVLTLVTSWGTWPLLLLLLDDRIEDLIARLRSSAPRPA